VEAVTRIGLQIPNFTYPGVADGELFDRITAIAQAAERSGFDSLWVMDHLYQIPSVGPRSDPMLDAYTLLGGIAARTERARLGTMVTGVTYRNPAQLAKIVTTLDVVSRGRAILGIGAAWNEDEHRGYGFRFPPIRERLERLEEALQICRAMFREPAPSLAGRHYRIEAALNEPRPLRPGGPPILVGGGGERRLIPLVARYADAWNVFGDLDAIRHKLSVLEQACERAGRDPAEITKTRLGALVVAEDEAQLERKLDALRAARPIDEAQLRGYVLAGTPDRVVEQVEAFLDAGLDGMIFNLHDAHELEPVALAGETLARTRLAREPLRR